MTSPSVTSPDNTTDDTTPKNPRITFAHLPAELRHQTWRLAVPERGINFFNVHCFPNDHANCNRSTSPSYVYLDLRRLSIDHDDDQVARYDPSVWQARQAVRQSCLEARIICAIPESRAATITLTRPKRGLFVRAGDGQLRTSSSLNAPDPPQAPEPLVHRTIQVCTDEAMCLSTENCSFNLSYEEVPFSSRDDDPERGDGWSYDPQLTPELPQAIDLHRLCVSMARRNVPTLGSTADALMGLVWGFENFHLQVSRIVQGKVPFNLMFDGEETTAASVEPLSLTPVFWDRFGDRYAWLDWPTADVHVPDGYIETSARYRRVLTRIAPTMNNIHELYLESARLYPSELPMNSLLTTAADDQK